MERSKLYFSLILAMIDASMEDIRLCETTDKTAWESFFLSQNGSFLQSWEWGDFQASVGNHPLRVQLLEDDRLIGQIQGFEHTLPLGMRYLYIPRILNAEPKALFSFLKDRKYIFVRIEPTQGVGSVTFQVPSFKTYHRQPSDTLVLDLAQTEEQLLAAMHAKTRYNIRLAERKGVRIEQKKDIELFWKLNTETTGRDGFVSHAKAYYKKQLNLEMTSQWNAYLGDECIASNICIGKGNTFTYLHGSSSSTHRNVMAPYLLQWKQIQFAKEHGYTAYDFWGISPTGQGQAQTTFHTLTWKVDDKLTGVSRFKAGFGGMRVSYPQPIEIALQPFKYKVIQFIKKLRGK